MPYDTTTSVLTTKRNLAPLGMTCFSFSHTPWTLTYLSTTLALNIILTSLIISRLWHCRIELQKVLGLEYGKHYSALSIVFIESAFMNAICSVLLLMSTARGFIYIYDFEIGMLFDVWVAIIPAVQVTPFQPFIFIYSHSKAGTLPFLGLLQLPHYLPWHPERIRELEQQCYYDESVNCCFRRSMLTQG